MHERDYDAYDLDDPKHPGWEDAMAEKADLDRKREKEDALERQHLLREIVADYDRRRSTRWGRFLLFLLRKTT